MIGHPSVKSAWISYIEHDFVARLGDGTLPLCSFKHFLKQDYLYLVQYARLNGLAAYKAETLDTIVGSARIVLHIHEELQMHIKFCESWGISQAELDTGRESVACTVYTKYIESIGNTRDWMSLQVALAACLIGEISIRAAPILTVPQVMERLQSGSLRARQQIRTLHTIRGSRTTAMRTTQRQSQLDAVRIMNVGMGASILIHGSACRKVRSAPITHTDR